MDPDGRRTSTRATLLAAAGQNRWPPAGSYMAATGQDLMAADMPPHRARNANLPAAPLCLLAAACARSRCLRITNLSAAALWWGWHRFSGPVRAEHTPPATARRTNTSHRQRLAHLRDVGGAPEQGSRSLSSSHINGVARTTAAHITGEPGHSHAGHRTGEVPRQRFAPDLALTSA